MLKKISILLACTLCFVSWGDSSSLIDLLVGKGIITYQKSLADYRLDDNVLRQELVGIIVNGLYGGSDKICSGYFRDVSATSPNTWACSSIEFAADKGLITRSNSTFRPQDSITVSETLAMILGSVCKNDRVPKDVWDTYQSGFSSGVLEWQRKTLINASLDGLIASPGSINPNSLATREQAFEYLAKELGRSDCEEVGLNSAPSEPETHNEPIRYTIELESYTTKDTNTLIRIIDEDGRIAQDFEGMVFLWVNDACEECVTGYEERLQSVPFMMGDDGEVFIQIYEDYIHDGFRYTVIPNFVEEYHDNSFRGVSLDERVVLESAPEEEPEITPSTSTEMLILSLEDDPVVGEANNLTITITDRGTQLLGTEFIMAIDGDANAQLGQANEYNGTFTIHDNSLTFPITFTTSGDATIYLYSFATDQDWELEVSVGVVSDLERDDTDLTVVYQEVSCDSQEFSLYGCDVCHKVSSPAVIWKSLAASPLQELVYLDELNYFSTASAVQTSESNWKFGDDIIWTEYEDVQEFYIGPGQALAFGIYNGTTSFPTGSILKYTLKYRDSNINTLEESDTKERTVCSMVQ